MNCNSIGEQVAQVLSTLPEWNCLEEFVTSFQVRWLQLGQTLQQQLVQQKIEETEAQYRGARTKRKKRYYTPLGEMVVWRRVYPFSDGYQVQVDLQLGLPQEKWLAPVLELACALGVSSEFPNAHKLFQQWTGIELTEKTLANQVEATGEQLQVIELDNQLRQDKESEETPLAPKIERTERIYVGVDGVMTPLNQQQGYKEAKVGVIFWEKDHQKPQEKRGMIRHREYLATLKPRGEFRNRVSQLYQLVVGQQTPQTVVIGDGAHWIWEMAQEQFPGAVEILDFFHLSEYVWAVAKEAYPKQEAVQKDWVKQQQQQDLATRLEELKSIFTQINTEIEQLSQQGELALPGTWIVRYRARGRGGTYWYYKWQSREPIFVTSSGKKSHHKYIGKAGSPAFIEAVEMMKSRTQVEGLQQVKHTLELGLEDLVEEATRFQEKNQKRGK